jgi:hypothetical protein
MNRQDTPMQRFFREFERNSSEGNVAASIAQFADVFLAAGPQGAQAVRASDFALALPKRFQFFADLGCKATELAAFEEQELDSRFKMVRTQWRMRFARGKEGERAVLADSIFLVDTGVEPFRIVFYLAKQDYMAMLRANGILKG